MARFHGGTIPEQEKNKWQEQAEKDGFDNLWSWLKWLARNRIKETGNK